MALKEDPATKISIHALREEGDTRTRQWRTGWRLFLSTPSARRATRRAAKARRCRYISIHALREEGDQGPPVKPNLLTSFLSTPSARRATAGL